MTTQEAAFAILILLTALVIAFAVRAIAIRRQRESERRLGTLAPESGVDLAPVSLAPPPVGGRRSRFDTWFETAVRRSGMDASPAGVLAVMLLFATLLGGGVYLWKDSLGLTALGVVLGIAVPLGVVWYRHRQYRWQLQSQIPDAFRMLAGSVRAGQPLDQAIEFYAERGTKPLSEEFAHCAGLIRLGMSPAAALESTSARVRLMDFDLLVSTVGLYMQTGGNLVLLLERLADSVRDRNQYIGQFAAATAQSRIVAVAIGLAAPLMLLVYALVEPDHVKTFFESSAGWGVLGICAALEVIGILWMWRILRVDY